MSEKLKNNFALKIRADKKSLFFSLQLSFRVKRGILKMDDWIVNEMRYYANVQRVDFR